MIPLPRWRIPRAPLPIDGAVVGPWAWREVPRLPPLVLADGSAPAEQRTAVRLCSDDEQLAIRFDCEDRRAWSTFTARDEPLWQEEAVEIFLAAGAADPSRYVEIEVSPRGVLFDALVDNPTGRREDLRADTAWDCPGILWGAGPAGTNREDWWAVVALPWRALGVDEIPATLRGNVYRIERPGDAADEFSAWSPTLRTPPDFHQPARFGFFSVGGRMA